MKNTKFTIEQLDEVLAKIDAHNKAKAKAKTSTSNKTKDNTVLVEGYGVAKI